MDQVYTSSISITSIVEYSQFNWINSRIGESKQAIVEIRIDIKASDRVLPVVPQKVVCPRPHVVNIDVKVLDMRVDVGPVVKLWFNNWILMDLK